MMSRWTWHALGAVIFAVFLSLILYGKFSGASAGALSITVWTTLICAATALLLCSEKLSPQTPTIAQVLGWALVIRLLTLWSTPYFEDDFYRYLWDGYQTVIGGNPYLYAPSKFFASDILVLGGTPVPERITQALSALNNPDIPTIYGPALQWLFAFAAYIGPGALWPIRVLWLSLDLALVYVLISQFGTRRAALYALSPLVLHEVGVAMHPDGVIGALLFFAWVALKKQQLWRCGVWLGCATAMKVNALLALPFLLLAIPAISSAGSLNTATLLGLLVPCARVIFACGLTYIVFWLPFLLPPIGSVEAVIQAFRSLSTFARDWQFNALGFGLIRSVVDSHTARVTAGGLMCLSWAAIAIWQVRQYRGKLSQTTLLDTPKTTLVGAFGVLLLFAPVVNSWYLLWLLPLAAGTRFVTPWVASLVLPLSYLTYFNLGLNAGITIGSPYSLPIAIPVIEGLAIGLALYWDMWSVTSRRRHH